MRILIFSTNYLPNVGGAEIAVKEITDRLPQYQFDMIVPRLSRALPKREKIGNVVVHRVGFGTTLDKFLIAPIGARKAYTLHKKQRYDIAWSIMASQASVAAAWFKKHNLDVPLILTLQEGDEEDHLKRYALGSEFLYQRLIRPWHMKVFQYADHATAISTYLKERIIQNGIPADRITIVPNGVDLEKFQEASGKRQGFEEPDRAGKSLALRSERQYNNENEERAELRKRLEVKEATPIIFTASRLVRKNAIGDLISAMKYLPEHTKLIIAGDGGEREALKARAYKFGDRVKFVGTLSHDELPTYLHASDVFVRPSLSEGMGSAFIEAMAAGVPVVGTEVGGIPDFLEHEKTGLFCEVKNPQSIALQVARLLDDEVLRERVIENAQKMVGERYSWDMIAEQMKEVFDTIKNT